VKCKRERERGLGFKIEREGCFGPHKDEYRAGILELGSSEVHYHLTIDRREGKGQPGSCRLEKAKGKGKGKGKGSEWQRLCWRVVAVAHQALPNVKGIKMSE
jgi:hypothetical protein